MVKIQTRNASIPFAINTQTYNSVLNLFSFAIGFELVTNTVEMRVVTLAVVFKYNTSIVPTGCVLGSIDGVPLGAKLGTALGGVLGDALGAVGSYVGILLGFKVGIVVGCVLGESLGIALGSVVGRSLGILLGAADGAVGFILGFDVGSSVGAVGILVGWAVGLVLGAPVFKRSQFVQMMSLVLFSTKVNSDMFVFPTNVLLMILIVAFLFDESILIKFTPFISLLNRLFKRRLVLLNIPLPMLSLKYVL